MSDEAKKIFEELMNDLDMTRKITVKYLGKERTFEYKKLGQELSIIQEKYLDWDNLNRTALKTEREAAWAQLRKANPEIYSDKARKNFPSELLDMISLKINEEENKLGEDFQTPSNEGDSKTTS